jgi:hypothetical protein
MTNTMTRKITSTIVGVVSAAFGYFLFKYSLYLAATRIYQVDECQNVFVARILATGQAENYFTGITLFLAPLVWLARDATQSAELFASARVVSLLIFWLNLLLLALATGEKLLSRRGLIALVGAATLAPLWDYGFEIRHDNLLLTGLLLTWCVARVHPAGLPSYFIAGALAVGMQFTAFKAFVYTIPLTIAILAFPAPGNRASRWKLALAWATGALVAFLAVRLSYGAAGIWEVYRSGFRLVSEASAGGGRFAPWRTLARLLSQTPLLLALLPAGLIAVAVDLRRRGKDALTWESCLAEALLFLVAFGALVINPVPHPYNLVNLVPFAFLLGYRYASAIASEIWLHPSLRSMIFTLLMFTHFVPFWLATRRHLEWPNHRQENFMRLAEQLTDPAKDLVYDGIGMVPTRRSIDFQWFLHSLNIRDFRRGGELRVREMLAEQPAAVIIQSYRTSWLPEEDHEFIRERYVPLADDFWVLGKILPPGAGEFEIHHPGRYHIAPKEASNLAGTYEYTLAALKEARGKKAIEPDFVATLDGVPLTNRTVELTVGVHRLETAADVIPTVVWAGPKLKQASRVSDSSDRKLFVNWY